MSVMKKNFIIVALTFFLTIPSLLLAQNTDKTVAKIRKDYAAAMEKIKFSGDYYDNLYINSIVVNVNEMWGGSGPHSEKTEIYYNMGNDESWSMDRTVFFVRSKWNVSVREFFVEILYNEKGLPEFYFYKLYGYDGKPYEFRYYWENGKLIKSICPEAVNSEALPEADVPTPKDAYKAAIKYRNIDNLLY